MRKASLADICDPHEGLTSRFRWIFSKDAELLNGGNGFRFYMDDGRSDLTVQSVANPDNDSPAMFLAKKHPSAGIIYKSMTPNFFVVSSIRNKGCGTIAATGRTDVSIAS